MEQQKQIYRIFWEKTDRQNAKIIRIFTNLPMIHIPNQIEQYPVTELGDYCFAPDCKLPNTFLTTDNITSDTVVRELCGNYLNTIWLPNTLLKIGNYVFYNCRNLLTISFAGNLKEIGSDAFMNCHNLHEIFLRCHPYEKTCVQRILMQISWDIEIAFVGSSNDDSLQKEAAIVYPEYYEAYDEIAPAHIFGKNIIGEGFRARQCFHDGMIDLLEYDQIFPKACIEESEQILCKIAFNRLFYPYNLTKESKLQYTNYIKAHDNILCQQFITEKRTNELLFLLKENLLSSRTIQSALTLAAQSEWSEGNASILRWKQHHQKLSVHAKYKFDDF